MEMQRSSFVHHSCCLSFSLRLIHILSGAFVSGRDYIFVFYVTAVEYHIYDWYLIYVNKFISCNVTLRVKC